MEITLNGKKVTDYEIRVDSFRDHDDYEAFFVWAEFEDGTEATEDELEELDETYDTVCYEAALEAKTGGADFGD